MFVTFEISTADSTVLDNLSVAVANGTNISEKRAEKIEHLAGSSKLMGAGKESSITLQVTYKCTNQEEVNQIRENLEKQAKKPLAVSVSYNTKNK